MIDRIPCRPHLSTDVHWENFRKECIDFSQNFQIIQDDVYQSYNLVMEKNLSALISAGAKKVTPAKITRKPPSPWCVG